jgi:hypothetical protein
MGEEDQGKDVRGILPLLRPDKPYFINRITLSLVEAGNSWSLQTHVPLNSEIRWSTNFNEERHLGFLFLEDEAIFTSSTRIAVEGKPLKNVISHPVLDRHRLTMRNIESIGGDVTVNIIIDEDVMGLKEIAAIDRK